MSDDWRLQAVLREDGFAHELTERLASTELEHDLEREFGDRVAVSRDGAEVFCYAGTREQLDRAAAVIRNMAAANSWDVTFQLRRWHPDAEEWEDPDDPLPATAGQRAAEHSELISSEREEAARQGFPEYEVRVECRSRGDAVQLAARLSDEGLPNVRRWRYVVVGATDEDAAQRLAERLRGEAPAGSQVTAEATPAEVAATTGANPFAFFGGMAG